MNIKKSEAILYEMNHFNTLNNQLKQQENLSCLQVLLIQAQLTHQIKCLNRSHDSNACIIITYLIGLVS